MPKLVLDADELYDFRMIGIASPEAEYRFCWTLNKLMDWQLERADDIVAGSQRFATYTSPDEDEIRSYQLVCNRYLNETLIPELGTLNYFLLVKGDCSDEEAEALLNRITGMEGVFLAEMIQVAKIKSTNKEYLLF